VTSARLAGRQRHVPRTLWLSGNGPLDRGVGLRLLASQHDLAIGFFEPDDALFQSTDHGCLVYLVGNLLDPFAHLVVFASDQSHVVKV
jgi:hypothetical protein